eukprot:2955919-Rhodomonas_salina.3
MKAGSEHAGDQHPRQHATPRHEHQLLAAGHLVTREPLGLQSASWLRDCTSELGLLGHRPTGLTYIL